MKKNRTIIKCLTAVAFSIVSFLTSTASAQGTAFTYQGKLASSTNTANGVYDFTFAVWNASSGGVQQGVTFPTNAVPVTNGYFVATLDFGNIFTGNARWLEIAVRTNGAASFNTLAPRQALTATPYAIFANTASNLVGTLPAGQLSSGTANINISGNAATVANGLYTTGSYANPAWLTSLSASKIVGTVPIAALGNVWSLTGNAGTTAGANYLGTSDNQPLYLDVNGSPVLMLTTNNSLNMGSSTATGYYSIAMGCSNLVDLDINFSTIAGGQLNQILKYDGGPYGQFIPTYSVIAGGQNNTILSDKSVISGGVGNKIGLLSGTSNQGSGHTIGGGNGNKIGYENNNSTISGGNGNFVDGSSATIAGGSGNTIHWDGPSSGNSIGGGTGNYVNSSGGNCSIGGGADNSIDSQEGYCVISGGQFNLVGGGTGVFSTIGGGHQNTVKGVSATVPGGRQNQASGDYSFAAGDQAQAANSHAFVWSDGSAVTTSTADNQFMVRASGGVIFYSGSANTTYAYLAPGSGSFTSMSDRNAKEHFQSVNPQDVLGRVVAMPVNTWNYKTQPDSIRHIGPTAQDFKAAFAVGETDTGISTVDEGGVALAAIQGLNQKLNEKDTEITELKARMEKLEQLMTEKTGGTK